MQSLPKPDNRASATQIETLLQVTQRLQQGTDDAIAKALALTCTFLGLEFGIVSHIDGDAYIIEHCHAPEGTLEPGQRFALGTTYCDLTLKAQDVLTIESVRHSQHKGHPCFESFNLESYIGVPLLVEGQPYGTLNFSSASPYSRAWNDNDRMLMRLMAQIVSNAIERQRTDTQLAKTLRALERSNQELEAFAQRVSHDLVAPLRSIEQLSLWLREDIGNVLQDASQEHLALLQNRVGRMKNLVHGLLDYSRLTHQHGQETIELRPFIEDIVALLDAQPGCHIRFDLQAQTITAPRTPLELALRNLIDNALNHPERATTLAQQQRDGFIRAMAREPERRWERIHWTRVR